MTDDGRTHHADCRHIECLEARLAESRAHAGRLAAALENLGHGQVGDLFCTCGDELCTCGATPCACPKSPGCAATAVDAALAATPEQSGALWAAMVELEACARKWHGSCDWSEAAGELNEPCPCCGAKTKEYAAEELAVGVPLPERWECECYCWQRVVCLRCSKCVRHCECIKGQKYKAKAAPKKITQAEFFEFSKVKKEEKK